MGAVLKTWKYGGFSKGYDSFDGSKSAVENEAYPYGKNSYPTGRGSVGKAPGAARYGGQVNPGFAVQNGIQYKTASFDYLIVHSGTQTWRKTSPTVWTAMTGAAWLSTERVWFVQAIDRLYACQSTGALYYTVDGLSWTALPTSGAGKGQCGVTPRFYNQRLYIIDPATGYIWYSNPYTTTTSPPARAAGDFGTFDTDLTATPKKNAGFIELIPGSGVIPTCLYFDSADSTEALYAYTARNGYFKITAVSTALADGSIAHSVIQSNGYFGTFAPLSVGKIGNDQWFYDGMMLNSLGEVALYNNIRVSPKFGQLKQDLGSINSSYASLPALGFLDNVVYFAYPTGTYNDRVIPYDTILKAPGSPMYGFNCAFFLRYQDGNVQRLLYGSSNPSDSYVYDMGNGIDVGNVPVPFEFETKSTNNDLPGIVKMLAKATVFYTQIYGTINYALIFDEDRQITGSIQVGTSTNHPAGLGSTPLGLYMLGRDYDPNTTFATLSTNSYFQIEGEFEQYEKVSVRFTNSVSGESVTIDDVKFDFKALNPFVTLDT